MTKPIIAHDKATTDKYRNTYRINTPRATWHDYDAGIYFVTICTSGRKHYFGEIVHTTEKVPVMKFSDVGIFANVCAMAIESLHDDVSMPLHVVMPNHIHLIVIIHPNDNKQQSQTDEPRTQKQAAARKCGRLSRIISQFKSAISKHARQQHIEFAWQERFHERIVRGQDELNNISTYISNNVARWDVDEYHDESL